MHWIARFRGPANAETFRGWGLTLQLLSRKVRNLMKEETIPVVHGARTWVKGLGAGAKGLSLLHGKPAVVDPQAPKAKQQLQAHLMKEAETSHIISHLGNITLLYRNHQNYRMHNMCWVGGEGGGRQKSAQHVWELGRTPFHLAQCRPSVGYKYHRTLGMQQGIAAFTTGSSCHICHDNNGSNQPNSRHTRCPRGSNPSSPV